METDFFFFNFSHPVFFVQQYQQQQLVLTDKQMKTRLLTEKKQPCQDDFETIKLVSNGAYGYVTWR